MKRAISLVMAIAMVFAILALAGCSSNNTPSDKTTVTTADQSTAQTSGDNGTTGAKKYKIITIVKQIGIGWFDRMNEGIKQFASETGNDAIMEGPPKSDAALQVQMVQDAIAQKPDAICIVPYDPKAVEPVLKKARDAGIVVISHEADNLQNTDYDIEAFDNAAYGRFLMDALAKSMGGEGEFIITVGALTNTSHMQWVDAALAYQKEKYPNMKAVEDRLETNDNQQNAYNIMKEALKAHPNLKGFQGSSSQDAPGAALAVEEMGLTGKVSVVGTSLPSIASKFVSDGSLQMIGFWDPAQAGIAMNKLAVMVLDGKKADIKTGLDLGLDGYKNIQVRDGKYLTGEAMVGVTKDNLDQYKF